MAEKSSPEDEHRPGYEDARAELVEVVRALEAGGTTLEESLVLWERGTGLAADSRRRWAPRTADRTRSVPSAGHRGGRQRGRQLFDLPLRCGAEDQKCL